MRKSSVRCNASSRNSGRWDLNGHVRRTALQATEGAEKGGTGSRKGVSGRVWVRRICGFQDTLKVEGLRTGNCERRVRYVPLVGHDVSLRTCVVLSTSLHVRESRKSSDVTGDGRALSVQLDLFFFLGKRLWGFGILLDRRVHQKRICTLFCRFSLMGSPPE